MNLPETVIIYTDPEAFNGGKRPAALQNWSYLFVPSYVFLAMWPFVTQQYSMTMGQAKERWMQDLRNAGYTALIMSPQHDSNLVLVTRDKVTED